MHNIIKFLTENDYIVNTFEQNNVTYLQFSKNHLFVTFGSYYLHSIRQEENKLILRMQSDTEDKEYIFLSEKACMELLFSILEHDNQTKLLLEKLKEATMM